MAHFKENVVMSETKDDIIAAIKFHILISGGDYSDWYVGTSRNTAKKTLKGHNVEENGGGWICKRLVSTQVAKDVVTYFIDLLGTDGAINRTEFDVGTMVYAYKKSHKTTP